MSLDDIIKSNRKPTGSRGRGVGGSSSGGRGFGGSGSGSAPSRRFANRVGNRSVPYSRPVQQQVAQDAMWQNDVFATDASVAAAFGHQSAGIGVGVGVGGSSIETGTKLYISNLDYGVSNEDIKELFSEVGDLKRYGIHYDRSGRSKGTAEVVFSRRGDALAAVKRYNNVQLDGKLMKIEILDWSYQLIEEEEEEVLWGGLVVVLAVVISVVVGELEEEEEVVVAVAEDAMKRYLQRILMLNWTSTTKRLWKQVKGATKSFARL
ncbi:unnamed protein product, partial [Thlaspi arvense]